MASRVLLTTSDVAPHAGAWIEITYAEISTASGLSLPMRERGLKYQPDRLCAGHEQVAPHAGAWIEMMDLISSFLRRPRRSPCGSVD